MSTALTTKQGKITIEDSVIQMVAGIAGSESYGVVGMSAMSATSAVTGALKGASASRGVRINVKNEALVIEMNVVLEYGTSLLAVAQNTIDNVKFAVESQCGVKVDAVNVFVKSIRVQDGI